MRNFTLKGKTIIFKVVTISKLVFQFLITSIQRHMVNDIEKNTENLFIEKFFSQDKTWKSL